MYTITKIGRSMFAIGLIALGMLCFVYQDFIVGRPPAWPAGFHFNHAVGYFSGVLLIICSLAILTGRLVTPAAWIIAALIVFLSIGRHLFSITDTWPNAFKALALAGGALIIAASVSTINTKKRLLLTGTLCLSAFLLVCGYAHFKYAAFVDTLIPAYIPFHRFWTVFCGICLCAGGAGLLIPNTRRRAALLSGVMIGGWFILLHVPRLLADTSNTSDRLGVCESFVFTGIFFCVAGLFKTNIFESGLEPFINTNAAQQPVGHPTKQ